jgi:hypothetical protein
LAFPPSLWADAAPVKAPAPPPPSGDVARAELLRTLQLGSWQLAHVVAGRLPVLRSLRPLEYKIALAPYAACPSPFDKPVSELAAADVSALLAGWQSAVSAYIDKYGALSAPLRMNGPAGARPLPAVRAANGSLCLPKAAVTKPAPPSGNDPTPGLTLAAEATDEALAPFAATLDNFTGEPLSDEEGRLLVSWILTLRRFATTTTQAMAAARAETPAPPPAFALETDNAQKLRTALVVSKGAGPRAQAQALAGGARQEQNAAAPEFRPCEVDGKAKTCIAPGANDADLDARESIALALQPEDAHLGTHLDALRKLAIQQLIGQFVITGEFLGESHAALPDACRVPEDLKPFDRFHRELKDTLEAARWGARLQGVVASYAERLRTGASELPQTLRTAPFVDTANALANEWLVGHVSKKLKNPQGSDPADAAVRQQINRIQSELAAVSFGDRLPTNGGRTSDAFGLVDVFSVKLLQAMSIAAIELSKADAAKRAVLVESVVRDTLERVLVETLAAHGLALSRDEGLDVTALDRLWQLDFRHRWIRALRDPKNVAVLDAVAKDITGQFRDAGEWATPIDLAKLGDARLEKYTSEQLQNILEAQRAEDTARYMQNLIAEKEPKAFELPLGAATQATTLGIGTYEWRLAGGATGPASFRTDSPRFFQLDDRDGHGYGYTLTLPDAATKDGYASIRPGLLSLTARLQEKLVRRLREKGFTDERVRALFPEIQSTAVLANLLLARFSKALDGDATKTATYAGENRREALKPLAEWLIAFGTAVEYRAAVVQVGEERFRERLAPLFAPELASHRDAAWTAQLERELGVIRRELGIAGPADAEPAVLRTAAEKLVVAVTERQRFEGITQRLRTLREDGINSGKLAEDRWAPYCTADRKACRQWAESVVAPFADENLRKRLYDARLASATKTLVARFLDAHGAGKPQYGVAKLDGGQTSVVVSLQRPLVEQLVGRVSGPVPGNHPLFAQVDAVFRRASAAAHRARPLGSDVIVRNAAAEMAAIAQTERSAWEKRIADGLAAAWPAIDAGDAAALEGARRTLRSIVDGEGFLLTVAYLDESELGTPVGEVLATTLLPNFEDFLSRVEPLLRQFLAHGSGPSEELAEVTRSLGKARDLLAALEGEGKRKEADETRRTIERVERIHERLQGRAVAEGKLRTLLTGLLGPNAFVQAAVKQAFERSSAEDALFERYARDQFLRTKSDPRGEKTTKLTAEEALADLNELASGLVTLYPVSSEEAARFLGNLRKYLEEAGLPANAPAFAAAVEQWLAPSDILDGNPLTGIFWSGPLPILLPRLLPPAGKDQLKRRWEMAAAFAGVQPELVAPILVLASVGGTREAVVATLKKVGLDGEGIRKAALIRVQALEAAAKAGIEPLDTTLKRFADALPYWQQAASRPEATSAVGLVLAAVESRAAEVRRGRTMEERLIFFPLIQNALTQGEELLKSGAVPRALVPSFQRIVEWKRAFTDAENAFSKSRESWLADYWALADQTQPLRFLAGPFNQPLLGGDGKARQIAAPRSVPEPPNEVRVHDDFQVLQNVASLLALPVPGLKPHLQRFATEANLRELPTAEDGGRSLTPAERRAFFVHAEAAFEKEAFENGSLAAFKIFAEGPEEPLTIERFTRRMNGLFNLWARLEDSSRAISGGPAPEVPNAPTPGASNAPMLLAFKGLSRTIVRNWLAYLPLRIRHRDMLFPSTVGTVEDSLKTFDEAPEALQRQWVVWLWDRWRENSRRESSAFASNDARVFSKHFIDRPVGPAPTVLEKDWAFLAEYFSTGAAALVDPALEAWGKDGARFGRLEKAANVFNLAVEKGRKEGQAGSFARWLSELSTSPTVTTRFETLRAGAIAQANLRRELRPRVDAEGALVDPRPALAAAGLAPVAAIVGGGSGRPRLWEHYASLADFLREEGTILQARIELLDQASRNEFQPETFPYALALLHWDINVYGRRGQWTLDPSSAVIATAPREATLSMMMGEILELTGMRLDDMFAWKRLLENHELAAPEDWLEIAKAQRGLLAGYRQQRFLSTRVEALYVRSPVPLGVNYNYRPIPIVDPRQRTGLAPDMTLEQYLAQVDSDASYELVRTGTPDGSTVTLFEHNAALASQMTGEGDLTARPLRDSVATRSGRWEEKDFVATDVPAERLERIKAQAKAYGVEAIDETLLPKLVRIREALVRFQRQAGELVERLPSEESDLSKLNVKLLQGRGNVARIPFSGVSGELNAMLKAFAKAIDYSGNVPEITFLEGRITFRSARRAVARAIYLASQMARERAFAGADAAQTRDRELVLAATDAVYQVLNQKQGVRTGIETVRTNVRNQLGRLCAASWVKNVRTEDDYKEQWKRLASALHEEGESQLLQFDELQRFLYDDSGWIPDGSPADKIRRQVEKLGALKRWSEEAAEDAKRWMFRAMGLAILVFVQTRLSPGSVKWFGSRSLVIPRWVPFAGTRTFEYGRFGLAMVPLFTSGTFVAYEGLHTYEAFWGKPADHATRIAARDTYFQGDRALVSDEVAMTLEQSGREILAEQRSGWGWMWRAFGALAAVHAVQALNEVRLLCGLRLGPLASADSLAPAIARMSRLREALGLAKEDVVFRTAQAMSREEVERRLLAALTKELKGNGQDGRILLEEGAELQALRRDARKAYELLCKQANISPYTHEPLGAAAASGTAPAAGNPVSRFLQWAEAQGQRLDEAARVSVVAQAKMLQGLVMRLESSRVSLGLDDITLLLGSQKADPVLRHLPGWLDIFGVRRLAGVFSRDVRMLRRMQKLANASVDVLMLKDPQTLLQLINLSRLESVAPNGVRFAELYNPRRVDQLLRVPEQQRAALSQALDDLLRAAEQHVQINARSFANAAEMEKAKMTFLRRNLLASIDSSVAPFEGAEALVQANRALLEGPLRDVAPATRQFFAEALLHQRGLGMHPEARDIIGTLHRLGQWHARYGEVLRRTADAQGLTEEALIARMLREKPKSTARPGDAPLSEASGGGAAGVGGMEAPTVVRANEELHAIFSGTSLHHTQYFDFRLIEAIAREDYSVLALRFLQMRPFVPRIADVNLGRGDVFRRGNEPPSGTRSPDVSIEAMRARLYLENPSLAAGAADPLAEFSALNRARFFAPGEEEAVLKVLLDRRLDATALRDWIGRATARGELAGEALAVHRKAARTMELLEVAQRVPAEQRDAFVRYAVEQWRVADVGGSIPMSLTEARALLLTEQPGLAKAIADIERRLPSLESAKRVLFPEQMAIDVAAAELDIAVGRLTAEAVEARVRALASGGVPAAKLARVEEAARVVLESLSRSTPGSLPSEAMVEWAVARLRARALGREPRYLELSAEWLTAEKRLLGFSELGPMLPTRSRVEARFQELAGRADADRVALVAARDRLIAHRQQWDDYFVALDRGMTERGGEAARELTDALDAVANARYKLAHGGVPSPDWLARARTRLSGETANRVELDRAFQRVDDALHGRLGTGIDDAEIVRRAAALRGRVDARLVEEAEALLRRAASRPAGTEEPAVIADLLEVQPWLVTDANWVRWLPQWRPGPLAERSAHLFRGAKPTSAAEARWVTHWHGSLEPKSVVEAHLRDLESRLRTLLERAEGAERAALERAVSNVEASRPFLLVD